MSPQVALVHAPTTNVLLATLIRTRCPPLPVSNAVQARTPLQAALVHARTSNALLATLIMIRRPPQPAPLALLETMFPKAALVLALHSPVLQVLLTLTRALLLPAFFAMSAHTCLLPAQVPAPCVLLAQQITTTMLALRAHHVLRDHMCHKALLVPAPHLYAHLATLTMIRIHQQLASCVLLVPTLLLAVWALALLFNAQQALLTTTPTLPQLALRALLEHMFHLPAVVPVAHLLAPLATLMST